MLKWFKNKFKQKEEKLEKEELFQEIEEVEETEELPKEVKDFVEDFQEVEEKEELEKIEEEVVEEEEVEKDELFAEREEIESNEGLSEDNEKIDVKEELVQEIEINEEQIQENENIEHKVVEDTTNEVEENIEPFENPELPIIEEIKVAEKAPKKKSLFEKLMGGLTKTRNDISNKIDSILKSYKKIDEELFDDLEEVLVTADVGVNTTMTLIDNLRIRVKEEKVTEPEEVKKLLKDEIKNLMMESVSDNKLKVEPSPAIILVVGVNGVGKTTTIGKLAYSFKKQGKKVLIAAGDTFRAAAIEQLEEWGNRAGVDVISHSEGADPAAVIFDGIQAAKARKADILICDTAGRLHNKSNLMNELNKIFRITEREYGDATKEVLLVLDATTGQNALNQAKVFNEVANITGIALTKLDGTAKGGVIIALQSELKIPVKLVGVGEGIEDLQEFIIEDFAEAIIK